MKKNIAIIMGGYSREHDISIKSGNVVYHHLDRTKYNLFRVHILKKKWVYVSDDNTEHPIDRADFTVLVAGSKIIFDCVFNTIHGSPGEDGLIQAYLQLLGIPQTACGFYQAAITFNKRDLLSILKPYNIPSAASYYLNKGDIINEAEIIARVKLPCFVKANKSGSSFGVSKVYEAAALKQAIETAYKEDDEVIIEAFLEGREVSVGVIKYKGKTTVLPITEIITTNDFFDYNAKYENNAEEITPAKLSPTQIAKVTQYATTIYNVLKLNGFSRSEFIFVGDEPYLLEVNTTPGLTEASILPQQAAAAGIDLPTLFNNAIEAVVD